jgi:hypothetical protein
MSSFLQLHAIDYEQDNVEFEVEATKSSVENDKVEGIFLTWEDLWVTVSNGSNGKKSIFEGLKGYAKPILEKKSNAQCKNNSFID